MKRTKKTSEQAKTRSTTEEGPAQRSLLRAAKKLFARKGLNATSIRDIASEAGLNSSLISYYFDGKEGLYKACLKEIGESRFAVAEQILRPPGTQEEFRVRLVLFTENMFELYLDDRDTGLIIVREYDRLHSPAEEIFKNTFLKIFDLLIKYFKSGQEKGWVDHGKDPFTLASLFFGCLSSQMRLDHVKEKAYGKSIKTPAERKKVEEHLIDLFLIPKPSKP